MVINVIITKKKPPQLNEMVYLKCEHYS